MRLADLLVVFGVLSIFMNFLAIGYLLVGEGGTKEQKLMGYFLCGSLVQNVGYLMELTAQSLNEALIAVKVEYLGSLFVPLFYCWFIYDYCYIRRPALLLKTIAAINLGLLAVIYTCEYHTLYYRHLEWVTGKNGFSYLNLEYGPCYYLFLLCGTAIPYFLSLFALFRTIFRSNVTAGKRYRTIAMLSTLPVLALIGYSTKLTRGYDFTPAVMGIVLSVVVILVWSRRNYDFVHLAAETALANMGDGVISLDEQHRIISYNQAAAGIFSGLLTSVKGDLITEIHGFPQDILGETDKYEFSMGKRYYESHIRRISDKKGKAQGYVVLLLDMTDMRNYIEEIKRVREQAEQANAAKSEFLANMSHEIRTPMNAVIGLSDIIMEESQGRKVYTYACDIKSASQNLLSIINDILDLSKVEAGKMELVMSDYYIKGIVGDVVGMMDIVASQRGLLMKHEYEETIPCRYHGDEGRIKQIMINLLNNALKFTREGYVKLSVCGEPGEAEDEEKLIFRIEDTGCGIQKEDLEKIFENFSQVDTGRNRSVEGTGLGLSITKQLVQLMGGSIGVESVYGEGSVFTVVIPQKIVDRRTLEEVRDVPVEKEQEPEHFETSGCKVLVVDDNAINRKVAKGFLAPYGLELTEAESGPEAIALVKETAFDLIFMDHMMPEMDGVETLHEIQKMTDFPNKGTPVIALTANALSGSREGYLKEGFADFLTKPIDGDLLEQTAAKYLPAELIKTAQSDGQETEEKIARADCESFLEYGICLENGMKYAKNDLDMYLELVRLFVKDRGKQEDMRQFLSDGNLPDYAILVHGLKGNARTLGAEQLADMAFEHEKQSKAGNAAYVDGHFEELILLWEKTITGFEKFMESYGAEEEEKYQAAAGGEILPLSAGDLETVAALLDDFETSQAIERLKEWISHPIEPSMHECIKNVLTALEDEFDEDKAIALLREKGGSENGV